MPGICNDKSSALCVETAKFRQKRSERGRMQYVCRWAVTLTHSRQTQYSGIYFARSIASFHLINQFVITMNYRFSALAIGAFLAFNPLQSNAQGFGVTVDDAQAASNQIVCVPVRAIGFNDISSYQYSLKWDTQVLSFHHTQQFNLPDLTASYFNEITPGTILAGWSSPTGEGVTKVDGTTLYEVCFTAIGAVGSGTELVPGGDGFPPGSGSAEAHNDNFENIYNPGSNTPGFVEITAQAGTSGTSSALQNTENAFQLSPNPTTSSARVIFKAIKAENAVLLVTDAQGKAVMEQKISVRLGDNAFEIPASALNVKGMYQISLKTEQGVTSQMLSVQ